MVTDDGSLVFSISTETGNPRTIAYVNSNVKPCVVVDIWRGDLFENAHQTAKIMSADLEEIDRLFSEGVTLISICERKGIVFANIHQAGWVVETIVEGFGMIPRYIAQKCLTVIEAETNVEFQNYIANLGI